MDFCDSTQHTWNELHRLAWRWISTGVLDSAEAVSRGLLRGNGSTLRSIFSGRDHTEYLMTILAGRVYSCASIASSRSGPRFHGTEVLFQLKFSSNFVAVGARQADNSRYFRLVVILAGAGRPSEEVQKSLGKCSDCREDYRDFSDVVIRSPRWLTQGRVARLTLTQDSPGVMSMVMKLPDGLYDSRWDTQNSHPLAAGSSAPRCRVGSSSGSFSHLTMRQKSFAAR